MDTLQDSIFMNILRVELRKKGEVLLSVKGWSMEPLLYAGDRIKVEEACELKPGDVVVFLYHNDLLVHRIISMDDEMVCCKGDNAFSSELIPISMVLGIVTGVLVDNGEARLPEVQQEFIALSAQVGREFIRLGQNLVKIRKCAVFKQYQMYVREHFNRR